MLSRIRTAIGAATVFSLLALSPASFAQFGAFGRDFANLSKEDVALLKGAMQTVLEKQVVGATEAWRNETSGFAGVASLVKVYQQDGRQCGTVHHRFTAGGETEGAGKPYVLSQCKFEDGSWKIMP